MLSRHQRAECDGENTECGIKCKTLTNATEVCKDPKTTTKKVRERASRRSSTQKSGTVISYMLRVLSSVVMDMHFFLQTTRGRQCR